MLGERRGNQLYDIYFYKDKNGKQPVLDYLKELLAGNDKDSRVKANKISDYIQILSQHGTQVGMPYVKHLEGDLWELRPLRDRIIFAAWHNTSYILLCHFMKTTQKTPKGKIDKARRMLAKIKEEGQ